MKKLLIFTLLLLFSLNVGAWAPDAGRIITENGFIDYGTAFQILRTNTGATGYEWVTYAGAILDITDTQILHWDDAYDKRVDTWGDGLQYTAQTASIDYNTTNLKITATELNTIQNIHTGASPVFVDLTLTGDLNVADTSLFGGAMVVTDSITADSFIIGGDTLSSLTNLVSIEALSYSSTSFVKMTGGNTFSLDTNTYIETPVLIAPSAILFGDAGNPQGQDYDIDGTTWVTSSDGTCDQADHLEATCLEAMATAYDDTYFAIREGAGVVAGEHFPLTVQFTFTGVTTFAQVKMRCHYVGSVSHYLVVELYNGSTWDVLATMPDEDVFEVHSYEVLNPADYIDSGTVLLRGRHIQNGINSHHFLIDYLMLSTGAGGGGGGVQTAIQTPSTATGDVSATNVQAAITELASEKLALAGGTMTGAIAMGGNDITGAGDVTAEMVDASSSDSSFGATSFIGRFINTTSGSSSGTTIIVAIQGSINTAISTASGVLNLRGLDFSVQNAGDIGGLFQDISYEGLVVQSLLGAAGTTISGGASSSVVNSGATIRTTLGGIINADAINYGIRIIQADVITDGVGNITNHGLFLDITPDNPDLGSGGTMTSWALFNQNQVDIFMGPDNAITKWGTTDTDLQIYSDGTNGIIDVATALRIGNFETNYTEISSTGTIELHGSAQLGIGKTPTVALDVAGAGLFEGTLGVGTAPNPFSIIQASKTISADNVRGIFGNITNSSGASSFIGATGLNFGATIRPPFGHGTIIADNAVGLIVKPVLFGAPIASGSLTVTDVTGVKTETVLTRGAESFVRATNLRNFWATNPTLNNGATITNLYAFYDEGMTAGTNSWGFYGLSAQNYLSGKLGIGKTPSVALDVAGAIESSSTILGTQLQIDNSSIYIDTSGDDMVFTDTAVGTMTLAQIDAKADYSFGDNDFIGTGNFTTEGISTASKFSMVTYGGYSLGDEMLTNGTFTGNADDWTLTNWEYSSNTIVLDDDFVFSASQAIVDMVSPMVEGKSYRLVFTLSNWDSGEVTGWMTVNCGGETWIFTDGNGVHTYDFICTDDTDYLDFNNGLFGGAGLDCTLDDVSLKEINEGLESTAFMTADDSDNMIFKDDNTDTQTLTQLASFAELGGDDLGDTSADVLLGYDGADSALKYIVIGDGLTYTHATHTLSSSGGGVWGSITGTLSDQTDLQTELDELAAVVAGVISLKDFYTDVSTSTLDEEDLYSYTVPANTLANDGEKIEAEFSGIKDSTGTNLQELRVYFAGSVIGNSLDDSTLFEYWSVRVQIIRTGETTARSCVSIYYGVNPFSTYLYEIQGLIRVRDLGSKDWTATNILKITGESDSVNYVTTAKLGTIKWVAAGRDN